MEQYSAIKKNTTTWINFEGIRLSEKNPNAKHYIQNFIYILEMTNL